jgi:hypothetical protein
MTSLLFRSCVLSVPYYFLSSFFGFLFIPTKEGSHLLTSILPPYTLPTPIATPVKNESKETQKQLFSGRSDRLTVRKGMMREMRGDAKSSERFCRKQHNWRPSHVLLLIWNVKIKAKYSVEYYAHFGFLTLKLITNKTKQNNLRGF